ncbi:MAG: hypothetical protein O7I93_00960 [Gemmatimonadetes bacterium]|nr:hypothetical protein [Gemmatimonadota bacterium]
MRALAIGIGAAVLLTLASVESAAAQSNVRVAARAEVNLGPVRGHVEVRNTPRARRVPYRRPTPRVYRNRTYRSRAPRYCWDGYGHPRYGWSHCVDAGWVQPSFGGNWFAVYDNHLQFRHYGRRRDTRYLDAYELRRLLGHRAFHRLERYSYRNRIRGPLWGEWIQLEGGAVALGVFEGHLPVAELRDQNRDGYVDVTFVYGTVR